MWMVGPIEKMTLKKDLMEVIELAMLGEEGSMGKEQQMQRPFVLF